MLATIRDDTWYVHNMHHIPNNKRWDYLEFLLVALLELNNPCTHMVEGGRHLTAYEI